MFDEQSWQRWFHGFYDGFFQPSDGEYWRYACRYICPEYEDDEVLQQGLWHVAASSKSLSEFFYRASFAGPDLLGLYYTWWGVDTLDNVPMSMYEKEELSRSKMEDIFSVVYCINNIGIMLKKIAEVLEKWDDEMDKKNAYCRSVLSEPERFFAKRVKNWGMHPENNPELTEEIKSGKH